MSRWRSRSRSGRRPGVSGGADEPTRILLLAANPPETGRLGVELEIRDIRQFLQQATYGRQFELRSEFAVRPPDIQEHILRHRPAILHFSGHNVTAAERARAGAREFSASASARARRRGPGGLIIRARDDSAVELPPEALRALLQQFSDELRCVVLNACETHEQAEALAGSIDFVIGMSRALDDEAAIAFSASFYRALAFGESIERAFHLGRNAIAMVVGLGEHEVPRLFTREGGPSASQFRFAGEGDGASASGDAPAPSRDAAVTRPRGAAASRVEAPASPGRARRRAADGSGSSPARLDPFPGARMLRDVDAPSRRVTLDAIGERDGDRVVWRFRARGQPAVVRAREATGVQALLERARLLHARPDGALALRLGQALTRFVFGAPDEPGYDEVFRALLDRRGVSRAGPAHVPARCRLHLRDATLLSLPWALMAEGADWLLDDGWTFELARAARPRKSVRLPGPCAVLVIAPRATGGNLDPVPHFDDIEDVLTRAWPLVGRRGVAQHLELARAWSEVRRLLRTRKPDIVYFYGRASMTGGAPTLRLDLAGDGHEDIPLGELLDALGGRARALYLNTDSRRPLSLAQVDTSALPCVIAPTRPAGGIEGDAAGAQWLWMMLKQGLDPVAALQAVARERSTLRAATMCAHTRFDEWITDVAPSEDCSGRARLRVDRTVQRAQLLEGIRTLASHPTRLVESVVVCGEDPYSMRHLGDLLYQHVHDFGPASVRVVRNRIPLPRERAALLEQLRALLREELLELEPGESVTRGIARKLAEIPARQGARKLLWIDWGAVGPGTKSPALQVRDLVEWLRFAADELGTHCPRSVRILSLLSISASARGCARIEEYLDDLIPRRHASIVFSPSAHYTRLPRPGAVSKRDLIDFLDKYSSCPKDLISPVSTVINARAAGSFEAVVTAIEEVETGAVTWSELARALPSESEREPAARYDEDELIQ